LRLTIPIVAEQSLDRLPPQPSSALAFGTAPAALPVTSPAVSAVQFRHLLQIIGADVVSNIVWRHPIAGIGVNDCEAMVGSMRRHQPYDVFRNLDYRDGGHLSLR
jgi:hypothetical protein